MEYGDIDLICVIWDNDCGIVSLRQSKWLFYCWGRMSGHNLNGLPLVGIEDQDFRCLPEKKLYNKAYEEPCWADVYNLLVCRKFRKELLGRIKENEVG